MFESSQSSLDHWNSNTPVWIPFRPQRTSAAANGDQRRGTPSLQSSQCAAMACTSGLPAAKRFASAG
jgi:hypothetical protein